jgi:hypothetical protein
METDTLDSEGEEREVAPWQHVTPEALHAALHHFRGDIMQVRHRLATPLLPLYERTYVSYISSAVLPYTIATYHTYRKY